MLRAQRTASNWPKRANAWCAPWSGGLKRFNAEIDAVNELREKPAGVIRLTAGDHAIETAVWPKLTKFLTDYPDIKIEIVIDYGLTDKVEWTYGLPGRHLTCLWLLPQLRKSLLQARGGEIEEGAQFDRERRASRIDHTDGRQRRLVASQHHDQLAGIGKSFDNLVVEHPGHAEPRRRCVNSGLRSIDDQPWTKSGRR